MQKQKLFKIFSCVDHYAPELLGANRVVNHDVPKPSEVVAATVEAEVPKKPDDTTKKAADGAAAATGEEDSM